MLRNVSVKNSKELYFSLAEERNKWKMFSHTPLGPWPEDLFLSHVLSIVCHFLHHRHC